MNYRKVLAASLFTALAFAPSAWSQLVPEMNPKNTTSAESLAAMSQDLTEKISKAKSQGRDVSAAVAERARGERAMQQGNDQEAVQHFQAGEQALVISQPKASGNSGSGAPPASNR
jgi:hypothetical protein